MTRAVITAMCIITAMCNGLYRTARAVAHRVVSVTHTAVLLTLIALISVPIMGFYVPTVGAQQPRVVTCTLKRETATGNSRSEVAYYECVSPSGAVIPSVTFILKTDAPGELWLRQLDGRTVDVQLVVVR